MQQITPIFPPALKHGDRIRIVCPARSVVLDEILPAAEWIRRQGFKVEYGDTIGKVSGQFGGTDEERAADIQNAIDDDGIDAIWCARGGYGTARLLESLNLELLMKRPKWIIGYSDITALHAALYKIGIVSIHAPMPLSFNQNLETSIAFGLLLSYLMGRDIPLEWDKSSFDREGKTTGRLFGGNLSVIYSLRGTPWDVNLTDSLLFIEDVDEYLYHIDRMCNNLSLGGYFKQIKGLIAGQFTKMNDNTIPFGMSANEIVQRFANRSNVAVQCFNAPFGHVDYNLPILCGAQAELEVDKNKVTLKYHGRT